MKPTFIVLTLAFVFPLLGSTAAQAQEPISPEKRALIKEFLELQQVRRNTEAFVEIQLNQQEQALPQMLAAAVDNNPNLTAAERQAMRQGIIEGAAEASKRLRQYFKEHIDFGQVAEDISYPIYNKYFTEDELRDLIAFYKSATGRKYIAILPQVLNESTAMASEILLPKMQQAMNEVIGEAITDLAKRAHAEQNQPKQQTPARSRRGRRP